jgi:endonuclease/exonuclease/phosphatase family metal-dependent hydrolase
MRLRVLTYNIHKAIGIDGKFSPDRIVEILRHHDADVVMLQEVDRGVPRSDHLDLASHLGRALAYRHRAVGMNVHMKKGKYGNATLSRYRIDRQRNIDLTIGRRKRRGAQHTRIHVPVGRHELVVEVFNVHLSLLASLRRLQMTRLLQTTDVTGLSTDTPCIIGGDVNDWRNVLQRQFFGPAGFNCATNGHRRAGRSIKTFPSFAPTGGLDKLFYRGTLRLVHVGCSRLKLARVASDHLPVVADFELTTSARRG